MITLKTLVEMVTNPFSSALENPPLEQAFPLIKARKEIRTELKNALLVGTVIGIYSPALGDGLFLTAVEDIFSLGSQETVILKPYDYNGVLLVRNQLSIIEIKAVCPFTFPYRHPVVSCRTPA